MNISTIIRRPTVIIAAVAVFAAFAGAAQATWRPAGMSKAEYRALMLRSEALDHKYGLDVGSAKPAGMTHAEYRALMLRSQALDKQYGLDASSAKPAGMTPAEYRALMLRSRALDRQYGLDGQNVLTVVSAPAGSTDAFAWSAFGIGAAAMLGFVLLVVGVVLGSRAARHVPPVGTSS